METSIVIPDFVDARIGPRGSLENLSQAEIEKLLDSRAGGLYQLFRKCALAVLNSGSESDNAKEIFDRYRDFEVELVRQAWGVKLEMKNAPGQAFVDGEMIRGIKEHVFAVLRDVIFISNEIIESGRFDLNNPAAITNAVFHILRNARVLDFKSKPNLVVCWGGHSINTEEYKYTKHVGYELGLRGLVDRPELAGAGAADVLLGGDHRLARGRAVGEQVLLELVAALGVGLLGAGLALGGEDREHHFLAVRSLARLAAGGKRRCKDETDDQAGVDLATVHLSSTGGSRISTTSRLARLMP